MASGGDCSLGFVEGGGDEAAYCTEALPATAARQPPAPAAAPPAPQPHQPLDSSARDAPCHSASDPHQCGVGTSTRKACRSPPTSPLPPWHTYIMHPRKGSRALLWHRPPHATSLPFPSSTLLAPPAAREDSPAPRSVAEGDKAAVLKRQPPVSFHPRSLLGGTNKPGSQREFPYSGGAWPSLRPCFPPESVEGQSRHAATRALGRLWGATTSPTVLPTRPAAHRHRTSPVGSPLPPSLQSWQRHRKRRSSAARRGPQGTRAHWAALFPPFAS